MLSVGFLDLYSIGGVKGDRFGDHFVEHISGLFVEVDSFPADQVIVVFSHSSHQSLHYLMDSIMFFGSFVLDQETTIVFGEVVEGHSDGEAVLPELDGLEDAQVSDLVEEKLLVHRLGLLLLIGLEATDEMNFAGRKLIH